MKEYFSASMTCASWEDKPPDAIKVGMTPTSGHVTNNGRRSKPVGCMFIAASRLMTERR